MVADRGVRSGPASTVVGQRVGHRPTQPARCTVSASSAARWRHGCISSKPTTPSRRASWSVATGSSRRRSCPAAAFASPADFNAQFADWLDGANRRVVRTIKARPIDLVDADRAAMLALPPVPPRVGWFNQIRLGSRLLRAGRHERLLRRPGGDRPTGHRHRRPSIVSGSASTDDSWPITPGSGLDT